MLDTDFQKIFRQILMESISATKYYHSISVRTMTYLNKKNRGMSTDLQLLQSNMIRWINLLQS